MRYQDLIISIQNSAEFVASNMGAAEVDGIHASRIPSPTTLHIYSVRRMAISSATMVLRAARIIKRLCKSSRTAAMPPV